MDLYPVDNHMDEILARRADQTFTPIGGTFELLPLCNMDCKMCYIHQTPKQVSEQGRLLTCDEWLSIAEQALDSGVLFLLLTGGEPLLYPEFERLYKTLTNMGFVITVNTNATLLDEYWADIFEKQPCRRLNITLYGKDNETYQRLCNHPVGFTKVKKAAQLLKERNVPFRFTCSATPYNIVQLPDIFSVAREFDVPLDVCSYMFPPNRRIDEAPDFVRLTPSDAANAMITSYAEKYSRQDLHIVAKNTLDQIGKQADYSLMKGLTCRAGRSGFWIDWLGNMLPCGMFQNPKMNIIEHSFQECWNYVVSETQKLRRSDTCEKCEKRKICKTCAAACLTETGNTYGIPRYLCEMTDELIRCCKDIIAYSDI